MFEERTEHKSRILFLLFNLKGNGRTYENKLILDVWIKRER